MINERTDLLERSETLPRHLTEDGIIDELTNLIFAGTDTTGNTLAYLFWELSHNPEWQLKLRNELQNAVGDEPSPSYDTLTDLPILEAVLQETFRVHPAALSGLQRLVPGGGAVVAGIPVPEGVSEREQRLLKSSC
jgi:cytochrome P450